MTMFQRDVCTIQSVSVSHAGGSQSIQTHLTVALSLSLFTIAILVVVIIVIFMRIRRRGEWSNM